MSHWLLKYCLPTICILICITGYSQNLSIRGFFELNEIAGCAGLTVTVTNFTSSAPGTCYADIQCNTYWGDGTENNELTYTYNEAGSYYLTILFNESTGYDSVRVDVFESAPPEYDVNACTGQRAGIEITDTAFDSYIIDYGDGNQETINQGSAEPIHTYSSTATRTISIRGINNYAADNCPTETTDFTPLISLPEGVISALRVISSSQIVLDYNIEPNIEYRLQASVNNSGNFSTIPGYPTSGPDTLSGFNLAENFYCFRLITMNSCEDTPEATSATICSVNLQFSPQNNVNLLNWATADPSGDFSICKNGDCSFLTVPGGERMIEDRSTQCNREYTYQVIASYSNGSTSTSIAQTGIAISTTLPGPVNNVWTTNAENIEIGWEKPDNAVIELYEIFLINGNGPPSMLASTETNYYTTGDLNPSVSNCFQVFAIDECGNRSESSIEACTMVLTNAFSPAGTIILNWNSYTGYENNLANYTIQQVNGNNTDVNSNSYEVIDNGGNTQEFQFRVRANPNDGLSPSFSNILTVEKPSNIFYPNAFTPDGDGTNDIFYIRGLYIENFKLTVFNKWGELIYVSENMGEGWNGTYDGKPLPEGTYVFRAEMTDQAGNQLERDGTILLLRH